MRIPSRSSTGTACSACLKANELMKRLMVKPIPQSNATPYICPQFAPLGKRARPAFMASQEKPNTPIWLPINNPAAMDEINARYGKNAVYPAAMPSGTEWTNELTLIPSNEIPVFANANNGKIP